MYRIELTPEVIDDLKKLRKFDLKRIMDGIEHQLAQEPTKETRNRKRLRPNQLAQWEL
jgi:mRNA-degrading endonuclease RelE of RelBE toxin-antitoxin system